MDELNSGWKARVSVAPEDYERACDIIIPILTYYVLAFKLIDPRENRTRTSTDQRKLDALCKRHIDFTSFCTGSVGLDTLIEGLGHVYELTPKKENLYETIKAYLTFIYGLAQNYMLDGETPYEQIEKIYLDLIRKANKLIKSHQRFSNGMQITIYLESGLEEQYQRMLEEVEVILLAAGIKPGVIDKSERRLGHFCSIRHQGDTYTLASAREGYNPDGVDDPFETLSTYTSPKL